MNCFCKSKEGKERASANGVCETGKQKSKNRLYKKKGERSNGGAAGDTKLQMDGLGHSKKANISPKTEKQKSFCWERTTEVHETSVDIQRYGTMLADVAYMPVSKNDPYYNMNHPRRGRAVIFNFDHWDNTTIPDLELSPRRGSQKDKNDLTECLKKLDFEVTSHDNCGNLEMWSILEQLRKEDHSEADCLVVAIFTHGERNTVFVRDGTQIPVNLIWENFEAHACPSLAGKPKIFIVQACRGRKYDSGTILAPGTQRSEQRPSVDVTDSATFSYVIPNAADIIVAFSCPLGHYSWRHPERGSWFIQSICKVFGEHAYSMDLQNLFTTVAREVALNYESNTDEWETDGKKQVTSTCSTLIRTVQFAPKRVLISNGFTGLEIATSSIQLIEENKVEASNKLLEDQDALKSEKDPEVESSDSSANTNL